MPLLKSKPQADLLYACLESHTSKHGTFRTGDQLRGDHPAVADFPAFWTRADAGNLEFAARQLERRKLQLAKEDKRR
jgi:hypothetical protein